MGVVSPDAEIAGCRAARGGVVDRHAWSLSCGRRLVQAAAQFLGTGEAPLVPASKIRKKSIGSRNKSTADPIARIVLHAHGLAPGTDPTAACRRNNCGG